VRRDDGSTIVYYKELAPMRLHRALSRRGPGYKDYRVTFSRGPKLLVRCSRETCFADLMGPETLYRYAQISHLIKPGMRVLEIAPRVMSSGYGAAYLTELAGPSGAVVSLVNDRVLAHFAAHRYRAANLSIEWLNSDLITALAGETDGSFDAVVAIDPLGTADAPSDVLVELWRVLKQEGVLVLGRHRTGGLEIEAPVDRIRRAYAPSFTKVSSIELDDATVIVKPL
jgi:ubiquinone/menaquinone biosynthesis C-methylase UbiE